MHLAVFATAPEFRARAEPFLLAREAEHNVILGLATSLTLKPDLYPSRPYFATVEDGPTVIAAAVLTPPYRVVVSCCEAPAALQLLARDLQAVYPKMPGVVGPVPSSLIFAEAWQALTGQAFEHYVAERLYRLDRVTAPQNVPGRLRRAAEADRARLVEWITAFEREAFQNEAVDAARVARIVDNVLTLPPDHRGAFFWEAPGPVSLTGYGGPTPHSLRIGPVYTPPEFRGHGYASACVAAVSQSLLDAGRQFCTLFTDLANPTANKIYQQIGYRPVCDVDEYLFLQ